MLITGISNGVRSTKELIPSIRTGSSIKTTAFKPHGAFQNTMQNAVKLHHGGEHRGSPNMWNVTSADMTVRETSNQKLSFFQTFYGAMN